MKVDHKDVWVRALKTAVQAFVGVFVVAVSDLFDVYHRSGFTGLKSSAIALASAGLAAAVSAIWNYYLELRSVS